MYSGYVKSDYDWQNHKCWQVICNSNLKSPLSIKKKHEYTVGLSDEEVKNILAQHEYCYEKRLSDLNKWYFIADCEWIAKSQHCQRKS
jgi:hypothetical protein